MQRYLLLGTDTDVGKTTVAAALCLSSRRAGLRVCACKPVETGNGKDLETVRQLAGDEVRLAGGMRFAASVAPSAAARTAGVASPTIADCLAFVRDAERDADAVIVETCGGALTPLSSTEYVADLAVALPDYTVLLVAGLKLGVLSHAFGVLEYLRSQGRPLDGAVLCERFEPCDPWYVKSTKADLASRGVAVLAHIPFGAALHPDQLAAATGPILAAQRLSHPLANEAPC